MILSPEQNTQRKYKKVLQKTGKEKCQREFQRRTNVLDKEKQCECRVDKTDRGKPTSTKTCIFRYFHTSKNSYPKIKQLEVPRE